MPRGGNCSQGLILKWKRQIPSSTAMWSTLCWKYDQAGVRSQGSAVTSRRGDMNWSLKGRPAWTTATEYLLQPGMVLWALFIFFHVSPTTVTPGQPSGILCPLFLKQFRTLKLQRVSSVPLVPGQVSPALSCSALCHRAWPLHTPLLRFHCQLVQPSGRLGHRRWESSFLLNYAAMQPPQF